jgi:broad specificity phosphatase PhoE
MTPDLTIHLIRHGESEANLNKAVNRRLPDHRINLSPVGYAQSVATGIVLANDVLDTTGAYTLEGVAAYISPYARTRQTWVGIKEGMASAFREKASLLPATLAADEICNDRMRLQELARNVHHITAKESIHLRELEFGLFDGVPDNELAATFPREHGHYDKHKNFEGEFYARTPSGESRCDVAQRVHQFFGTLLRDHEKHGVRHALIVSHGVTTRAFAMMWMGLSVEWMENEPNPGNGSIRSIRGKHWLHPGTNGYVYGGPHLKVVNDTPTDHREDGCID